MTIQMLRKDTLAHTTYPAILRIVGRSAGEDQIADVARSEGDRIHNPSFEASEQWGSAHYRPCHSLRSAVEGPPECLP